MKTIFVTGGYGFIGSELVRTLVKNKGVHVVNIDCLTYAADPTSLNIIENEPNYTHLQIDIRDDSKIVDAFEKYSPTSIYHLAAESHVDNSIECPGIFVDTNVMGTLNLLKASLSLHKKGQDILFHHISTDEVFGTLGETGMFTEETPYNPNSPYSASKAASDHLVRAWKETYGLPTLITNCSNNYGPWQNREKLIPKIIESCLNETSIPIYGDGKNIRDWLYVSDHVDALIVTHSSGKIGHSFNIGGKNEMKNIDIANTICSLMDELKPRRNGHHADLIEFVADRPGHDYRYAIDPSKIEQTLNWRPKETFITGIEKTISHYIDALSEPSNQIDVR